MSLLNVQDKLRDLSINLTSDAINLGLKNAKEAAKVSKTYPSEQINLDLKIPSAGISTGINIATLNASVRPQDLKTTAGSAATDLQSITGSSKLSGDGELSITATLPTAEALAAAVQGSTTATSAEVKSIVKTNNTAVSENIVEQFVGDVFNEATGFAKSLANTMNSLTLIVDNFLNLISKGLSSILGDIIEDLFNNVGAAVDRVAVDEKNIPVAVPIEVKKKVAESVEKKDVKAAAELIKPYTVKTLDEVTEELKKVKVGAADNLQPVEKPEPIAVEVIKTDKLADEWKEEETPEDSPVFVNVGNDQFSIYSLLNDFTNLTRDISTVLVTSTGIPGLTLKDVHAERVKSKKQGVLDHFFISSDGMVTRGRPLSSSPGPSSTKNIIKIGIACKNEMNPNQSKSLKALLETLLLAKPGIQIYDFADLGWFTNSTNKVSNLTDFNVWRKTVLNYEYLPREELLSEIGKLSISKFAIPSTTLNKISNGYYNNE